MNVQEEHNLWTKTNTRALLSQLIYTPNKNHPNRVHKPGTPETVACTESHCVGLNVLTTAILQITSVQHEPRARHKIVQLQPFVAPATFAPLYANIRTMPTLSTTNLF